MQWDKNMKGGGEKTVGWHIPQTGTEKSTGVGRGADVPLNWWISEYGGEVRDEAARRGRKGPEMEGHMYLVDDGNH